MTFQNKNLSILKCQTLLKLRTFKNKLDQVEHLLFKKTFSCGQGRIHFFENFFSFEYLKAEVSHEILCSSKTVSAFKTKQKEEMFKQASVDILEHS